MGISAAIGEEISIRCRARDPDRQTGQTVIRPIRVRSTTWATKSGCCWKSAALLHDIGHFINTIDHDKHGYYILKANRLIGLNEHQQEMVASLVRYHRKAFP